MHISIFDLFKVGIGPSSSHTVGPMRAAAKFLVLFQEQYALEKIVRIKVGLYGSLALTGIGHGSDKAVIWGFCGYQPDKIDVDKAEVIFEKIKESSELLLLNKHNIRFDYKKDLQLIGKKLPQHANGMQFSAFDESDNLLFSKKFFSVGGGFFLSEDEMFKGEGRDPKKVTYQFTTADALLQLCKENDLTISQIIAANEAFFHSEKEIDEKIEAIWQVMKDCVEKGCNTEGILPGGLSVSRRAPSIAQKLKLRNYSPQQVFDWVSLYALAVNEENAAGGRVVTAPTNGAAGVVPAVLHYFEKYERRLTIADLKDFFFTAGAIGFLYKENASIAGAEMGCQGEVGVACSMAAAGLAALKKCTPQQVEVAAEIGMEHNLGLTCDPVKGLVQIPCIERNTMGAIKAINAARLAYNNEGTQKVSLDKVIKTMRQVGEDMKSRYKETSKGGLAINVVEC
ncbi:MAG: L-serine ammonia-lyase [Rickettsiales bacterium]|nr:L-serine ammonia-lyase [Rickettsiales bacterium]